MATEGSNGNRADEAGGTELKVPDFRRWLSSTYAWDATDSELQAMSRRYGVPGRRGYVSVDKFHKALNATTPRTEDGLKRKEKIGASTIDVPDNSQLPKSLQASRWNIEKIEAKIRAKLSQRTKIDRYQNLFLLFCGERVVKDTHNSTITKEKFVDALKNKLQILLNEEEANILFDRWDVNGDGTIDVREFAKALMPKDIDEEKIKFIGSDCHDFSRTITRVYNRPPAAHTFDDLFVDSRPGGALYDLTLQEIKALIRNKLEERMQIEGNCAQYQKMFRILSEGRNCSVDGMPKDMLKRKLMSKFNIKLTEEDFERLFDELDYDKNGVIDLREFMQSVFLPDFAEDGTGPTAIWNSSTSESFDLRPSRPTVNRTTPAPADAPSTPEAPPHLVQRLEALRSRITELIAEHKPDSSEEYFHAVLGGKPGDLPESNMSQDAFLHQLKLTLGLGLNKTDLAALITCFRGNSSGTIDAASFLDFIAASRSYLNGEPADRAMGPVASSEITVPRPPKLVVRRRTEDPRGPKPTRATSGASTQSAQGDPQEHRALSASKLTPDEIADRIRELLVSKSRLRGGSHFLFKQIYRIVRAGVKASNNSVGMISAEDFRQVFAKEAGIHMSQEEAQTLWRKYDTERRGVLHIATLAKKFLPVDSDGSHHLTPLSDQARTKSGSVRNHLFSIMGKANAQSSLVGTLPRATETNTSLSDSARSALVRQLPDPVVADPHTTRPMSASSFEGGFRTTGPAGMQNGGSYTARDDQTHATEFSQFMALQQASRNGGDSASVGTGRVSVTGSSPRTIEAAIETARRRRLGAKDSVAAAPTRAPAASPTHARRPSSATMRSSRPSPRSTRQTHMARSPSASFGLQGSASRSRPRPQSAGGARPRTSGGASTSRPGSRGEAQDRLQATRRMVYSPIKYDGRYMDRANS